MSICSVQAAKGDPALSQVLDRLDEVPKGAPQPVQPPHHQGVTRTQLIEHSRELRALVELPRCLIGEDAKAAGAGERILLQISILIEGC